MIIGLCIGGYECSTAPQAYYLSNPGLQTWVKEKSKKYSEMIKGTQFETTLPTLLSAGFFMSGGKARIKISRHISVQISQNQTELRFTYVF